MPNSRWLLLATIAVVAGSASPSQAQERVVAVTGVEEAITQSPVGLLADSLLFRAGDARRALDLLSSGLAASPADYALHWRAARAATALAVLREGRPALQDSLYRVAIAHGEAAVDLEPRGIDGRYWRVAAKGRLSLSADARGAASLASEISREVGELLALDSLHAGAHNALGRLNLEVMTLPRWKRAVGRAFLGDALDGTNWELAERHLLRAVVLEPANALYLRDLGALHFVRGRTQVARLLFQRLEGHTGLLPWDEVFRQEALRMLAEIEKASG